jgi:hypothetical protein
VLTLLGSRSGYPSSSSSSSSPLLPDKRASATNRGCLRFPGYCVTACGGLAHAKRGDGGCHHGRATMPPHPHPLRLHHHQQKGPGNSCDSHTDVPRCDSEALHHLAADNDGTPALGLLYRAVSGLSQKLDGSEDSKHVLVSILEHSVELAEEFATTEREKEKLIEESAALKYDLAQLELGLATEDLEKQRIIEDNAHKAAPGWLKPPGGRPSHLPRCNERDGETTPVGSWSAIWIVEDVGQTPDREMVNEHRSRKSLLCSSSSSS